MRYEAARIGVLGGTFDPFHNGHIAIAMAAVNACKLDELIFVPAGNPWMKAGKTLSSPFHRLTMTKNATQNYEKFTVSSIEVDKVGPSYTVETLEQIQEEKGKNLYLIIGADSIERFSEWKDSSRILSLSRLVIAARPQYKLSNLNLEIVNNSKHTITTIADININISASEIRQKVFLGESIGSMVPKAVATYIKLNNLYKDEV
jgi:nicotinate-nucleotide adenylyltransferase